MMRPLAVIGNVNVDLVMGPVAPWPQPGTEVILPQDDLRVGGAAGNAALAWAALGLPFQMAANLGSDPFGAWLASAFPHHAPHWPVSPRRTTLSVGLTHPDGERTFFTTEGHLRDLTAGTALACLYGAALQGGLMLLCGSFVTEGLTTAYNEIFDWADRHAIDVALDTGWPPGGWTDQMRAKTLAWTARSSILLLNEVEATGLTGAPDAASAAQALCQTMPKGATVVIKQGADGAHALASDGTVHHTLALPVRVLDTIGAGDIFNAGFLAALARGLALPDCLAQGTAVAATAISTQPRRYIDAEQDTPA